MSEIKEDIVLFNMGSSSGTWTLSQAFLLESGEEIDASSMDALLEIESGDSSNNDAIIGLYSSIGGQNYWLISIDEYIFLFYEIEEELL